MTPAQLSALKSEIQADPEGLGYAAHLPASPGAVVDLLNAQTETMVKAIATTTAQAWAAAGPYANIVDAGEKVIKNGVDASHPCRASCLMVRDTIVSGAPIHMERQDVQQMLAAWVLTGICSQAQSDDLYERAKQPASRAEVLGLPAPTISDLIAAGVI